MKRALVITLAIALAVGVTALAGCGAEVKVNTDNGEVEVNTDKGSLSIDTRTPTEAELGVPVYPGATSEGQINLSEGGGTQSAAVLWSDDDVNKVIAWYKDELAGKPELNEINMSEGGQQAVMITWRDGSAIKMVTIGVDQYDKKGKTKIGIGGGTAAVVRTGQVKAPLRRGLFFVYRGAAIPPAAPS